MNTQSVDLDLPKVEPAPWNRSVDMGSLLHDMLSVADRTACCNAICEKLAAAAAIQTVALYRHRVGDTEILWLEGVSPRGGVGDCVALEALRLDELARMDVSPPRLIFPVMLEDNILGALWMIAPRTLLREERDAMGRVASALAVTLDRWRLSEEVAELRAQVKECEDGVGTFVHEAKQILTTITLDTGCMTRRLAKDRVQRQAQASAQESRRTKRLEESELRLASCVHALARLVIKKALTAD